MIKLFIIVCLQISFLIASTEADFDESRSVGCLDILRCLFCCKLPPKPPVKEAVIIPSTSLPTPTTPTLTPISTALKETVQIDLSTTRTIIGQTDTLVEMSRAAFSSEVNGQLKDLGKLIKSGSYIEGDKILASISAQLELTYGTDPSIDLHDPRHCMSALAHVFVISATESVAHLKPSVEENFSLLRKMLRQIYKSGSPVLINAAPKHESVLNIAKSVISLCTIKAQMNKTTLEWDRDSRLEGIVATDERHSLAIRRVLHNLIGNAIHYSSGAKEPRIALTLSVFEESASWWCRFSVSDNGPGMSPDVVSSLFQLHYRAVETAHRSGSGLGLCISKNLVETMGGQISVKSEAGKGSEFSFAVPCSLVDVAVVDKKVTTEREISENPKRVIKKSTMMIGIADDNIPTVKMLDRFCKNYGFLADNIKCFYSGDLVSSFHEENPRHILFLDTNMPGKGGADVAREICIGSAERPIIVSISANSAESADRVDRSSGCMDEFLQKPLSYSGFVAILERHFIFSD